MRIKNNAILTLILMPLLLLGACEQQAGNNASDVDRIIFEPPNVHSKAVGRYLIHVNVLTTDQLPQEVARGYNIQRSKNRAMINVSIFEKQTNGESPVAATITVIAKNLSNQLKNVSFREIKENEPSSLYYIGELSVSHEETIIFDLDITPAGTTEPLRIRYRQKFYTQ